MAFNFNVDALIEKLEPAVASIADKMGTTGENLWTIGRAGMFAEGVAKLTIAAIFLGGFIVYLFVAKSILSKKNVDRETVGVLVGVGIIGGLIASMVGFFNLYEGLMAVLAPDYMLLKEIINIARTM